ncbi:helix-turn-helix domain-containing protein [Rubrivirga sp.]|uniref:AlbA family DNA-binding domain-containing protein n=1 Tax=Rubrivirga sp. TaxID=1885344 RepID=UPI003B529293
MTSDDVKRLAAMGEGRHLEFKNRVPRPDRIAREVIALANTDGGKVLVGVDDDGTVLGVKDAGEEFYALQTALDDRISPPVDLGFEPVRISRTREVLVVHVPASAERPHVLKPDRRPDGTRPKQRAFVRVADQSVEASREAVALMRAEGRGDAVTFTFGDAERRLLEYLDRHERITVRDYARMTKMPPWKASKALVMLARAGIVALHPREGGDDYFTAGLNGS